VPWRVSSSRISAAGADLNDATGRSTPSTGDTDATLRAVIDHTPIAIVVAALDGQIVLVNAAAERLFGYEGGELHGESVDRLVPRAGRDRHRRQRAAYHYRKGATGPIGSLRQLVGIRKDGGLVPVEIHLTQLPSAGDPLTMASIIDLTERRRLEQAVVESATRTQQRIGSDLHDGLGQQLTAVSFLIQAIRNARQQDPVEFADALQDVSKLISDAIAATRELSAGLAPPGLADDGLGVALRRLASTLMKTSATRIQAHVRGTRSAGLPEDIATHLYRIAQEACANAVKHSRAALVEVDLTFATGEIRLTIADDGDGIPTESRRPGLGLHTMKFRATAIGAALTIESRDGGGTLISCSLPLAGHPVPAPSTADGAGASPV
jgi:PAS domain S-box-containing protein